MIYKHQYFKLDTEKKKLFDHHGEETFISGTSKVFKLLEYLCESYPASVTITNINDHVDPLQSDVEIREDNVRNMRNEIRKALRQDLIKYENHVYSIIGRVEKFEKEPENKDLPVQGKTEIISRRINKRVLLVTVAIVLLVIGVLIFIQYKKGAFSLKPVNDMVLIPAGKFLMGSTDAQITQGYNLCQEQNQCSLQDYQSEYPQHEVSLPNFYIDRKEVSNADYALFMKAKKVAAPQYWNDSDLNSANQPVVGVNWNDATNYCQWLSERLPTEAEWEKTARGTDGRIWPWGNTWDGSKLNHGKGGMPGLDASDGYLYTAPVGADLGVSPYGVLDMAGNVDEWVFDTFNPYPGNDKYANSQYNKGLKIVRGGSYEEDSSIQRSASRTVWQPSNNDEATGFRCAKDAK